MKFLLTWFNCCDTLSARVMESFSSVRAFFISFSLKSPVNVEAALNIFVVAAA